MRTPSATAGVLGMANPAYWVRTTNTDNGFSLSLSQKETSTPRLPAKDGSRGFQRNMTSRDGVPTAPSTTR